ncbi:FAD-binding oxidoreductase [Aspergillus melleus]|uniref:FAD-binding oxidoreductase n=1 Tax=Aspergillus melleus TaxID=138277 RepID=UPI001E8DA134|nr:uncharacterized protein LDX57_010566 [Aspergillus melleus]KAH8432933.1 hypothetical protein LDX57_010566 [Aspergillus melleus]
MKSLLLSCIYATVALAASTSRISLCKALHDIDPAAIGPSDDGYVGLSTENWSATAWAEPSCIVRPSDATSLSKVVGLLVENEIQFAIRSGGHMPSPLGANINNGVLIDMSRFDNLVYDEKEQVVTIGAGLRWRDVYEGLEKYNRTAVGGRVLDVGVGGLILGSGLSYLSDLYGLACDNVVSFEIILPNGTLTTATHTHHPDLFWALKGGANNFGIVTTFTINTYPLPTVWGGIKIYTLDQLPSVLDAFHEYQSTPNKDPHANLMIQAAPLNESIGVLVNMVYLKPEANPAAFKPFEKLSTVADTTKVQSFVEMMGGAVLPDIPRWDWHATSFTPSRTLYSTISSLLVNAPELSTLSALNTGTLTIGFQPISSSVVTAGLARGGNALGLSPVDQTWLVLDVGWQFAKDDKTAHEATGSLRRKIEKAAKEEDEYVEYIFMNDASWDQDVIGHYGEGNVKRLQRVIGEYDGDGVWGRLVGGGFKVPS